MQQEQNTEINTDDHSILFPIVVMGGSEGSLQAISEILQNLSGSSDMAYLYIQHVNFNMVRATVEDLQQATKMPVVELKNQVHIKQNHVYLLASNKSVTIVNGLVNLSQRSLKTGDSMPIDLCMLMVAETQAVTAIGVLLSGSTQDGTLGLKAIKSAGGFTYAQDDSAEFKTTTKAAITEGVVDAVLSPGEIATELERLGKLQEVQTFFKNSENNREEENISSNEPYHDVSSILPILQILKSAIGVDFTNYKENTIRRRIVRRIILSKLETIAGYVDYLKNNKIEVSNLYRDLLINVTHFFRDGDAVQYLAKTILPELLKDKSYQNPLRIWVPACSTGEEAYSLAMLISENMSDHLNPQIVEIFATDLSESSITKARLGTYSVNDLNNVSPKRLSRFFIKLDGHYRINKAIRNMCVFAPHNVFKDPPFSRIHLISCCNLLIYLNNVLQKKILANFHYALHKNGYLVLGKSETTSNSANLFSAVDKKVKIYQKKNDVASRAIFDLNYHLPEVSSPHESQKRIVRKELTNNKNLDRIIDDLLLTEYVKPAVVINYEMDIVQFRGSTGLFLEPSPGKASLSLLKMARPGLALELRNAVHKAIKNNRQVETDNIEISYKGNVHRVGFEIIHLLKYTQEKLLLLVFDEKKFSSVPEKASLTKDRKLKQVEAELMALREDMLEIVEEQEAANEDLQSANEEIVSSNEELQSINEELETSKEELESSNEELLTINQELQISNEQLAESEEYIKSIVTTIREAVLLLDKSLRVVVVNRAFYNTFKVKEEDVEGKYVFEINNGEWDIPKLKKLLQHELPVHEHISGYELKHSFLGIGEKVLLINAGFITQKVHRQQFILLAIEDITEHRQAERLLEERESWLRNMADNVPVMIWVAGPDKNFTYLNKTWLAFTGRTLPKEVGIGWTEGVFKNDLEHTLTTYHESFEKKTAFNIEYRIKRHDGEYRWILNQAVPTFDEDHEFTGYTGSCIEIHDKRLMNDELENRVNERTQALLEANRKLEQSNNELQQFAYVASHDLQEPLRKIATFANRLKESESHKLPAEDPDYLEKIIASSELMRHLIEDLLNYSEIARKGGEFVSIDLNQVAKNSLANLDLLIQQKDARVSFGELPVIKAVPVQMTQLFDNLLNNALKFALPGQPPEITITSRKLSNEEIANMQRINTCAWYEISFRDAGIGFDEAFAEQIFVIFQRLNEVQDYPGTGIGLTLCRKIAENHGGWIYAESNRNNGAVFKIVLPATRPDLAS